MRRIAFWAAPPLLALVLFWPGLTAWFQKDDFAWLGLYDMVDSWGGFWAVLLKPYAQGTIRTLSERVFYTSFFALFGMHPLPYRCWVFLTHVATLTLLSLVTTKLTGSRAAGFLAAMIWTTNGALAFVLSWTAIYYESLCSLWFLLGLWFLIRYTESGERRFLICQWITFLLGFGILELNVVYPAIASAFCLCRAPRVLKRVLPMFLLSGVYVVVHFLVAPAAESGPYRLHWDASVIGTFWTYWKMALGPLRLINLGIYPSLGRSALTAALSIGLLAFLLSKLWQRQWMAAFYPAWFVIVLAPLLPLRDHIEDYYLTIPLIGLAMWGAWALVSGWQAGQTGKVITVVLALLYFAVNIPLARVNVISFHDGSQRIRAMVEGVVELRQREPGKAILLEGVDDYLFISAIQHRPWRLYHLDNVYLAPGTEQRLGTPPGLADFVYKSSDTTGTVAYSVQ